MVDGSNKCRTFTHVMSVKPKEGLNIGQFELKSLSYFSVKSTFLTCHVCNVTELIVTQTMIFIHNLVLFVCLNLIKL